MELLQGLYSLLLVCFFIRQTDSVIPNSSKNNEWRTWQYRCVNARCVREASTGASTATDGGAARSSPAACRLSCGRHGALWPRPTGAVLLSDQLLTLHPINIRFELKNVPANARSFVEAAKDIFLDNLERECGGNCSLPSDTILTVHLDIHSEDLTLNWATDEGYSLDMAVKGNEITVQINSETIFGARHGLETLSQLVAPYDAPPSGGSEHAGTRHGLLVLTGARIRDRPAYPHRGLMLDTARNFLPVQAILRTLDGMASSKLNVLHWHATDTQSFPLESPRVPQLSRFGAYSASQVYRPSDVRRVLDHARVRGIRVLLELDAPAHAGAGWQWGPAAGLGELAACWRYAPWRQRCVQPPCGQLNPANAHVFQVLADLYRDIADALPKGEVFHMGGDEVFFPCWNNTQQILDLLDSRGMGRERADFLRLWAEYQATALRLWDEAAAAPGLTPAPVVLWSSHLTSPSIIERYLPKDRYVIQTWVVGEDPLPSQLSELGYRVILSTKDAWYLDHGFWGSTQYHSWRAVYDNTLPRFKSVLGGEACMWTEYVDEHNLDTRVWPRAAAVGERLWADPAASSSGAEARLGRHRERLAARGLQPEVIQPRWCYLNEGECA